MVNYMSYFSNVGFKDGVVDPFGRLRTSSPHTVLDLKQVRDSLPLFFSDVQVSGSGTSSTYLEGQAATRLSVSANTIGRRVRQSKLSGVYQTGKGLLVESTFNFRGGVSGVTKSAGYYDDENGIGLRLAGTTPYVFIRSSASESSVDIAAAQSTWSIDKFDGTGPSGLVLDVSKAQIGGLDFQWLGVGRVRTALNINGKQYYFHEFNHANLVAGVYMSNPNLPIRYEISNDGTGAATSMDCICASIVVEGGQDEVLQTTFVDRGIADVVLSAAGTFVPALSVRLKSGAKGVRINPKSVEVFATTNMSYIWRLYLNPTISGVDSAAWTSVANSSLQYDIQRTAVNSLSGGYVIAGGFGSTTAQAKTSGGGAINSFLTLGFDVAGVSDEFVLGVARIDGTGGSILAGMEIGEMA